LIQESKQENKMLQEVLYSPQINHMPFHLLFFFFYLKYTMLD
jgi:hypothetical protein